MYYRCHSSLNRKMYWDTLKVCSAHHSQETKNSSQGNSYSTVLLFSDQGLEEGRPEGLLASAPLLPITKICQERKMPKLHRTIFVLIYSAENESYPYPFPKQLTFLSEAPDIGLLMLSFPKVLLSFLRNREKDSSDYFYQFIFCSYKNYIHTHIFLSTFITATS